MSEQIDIMIYNLRISLKIYLLEVLKTVQASDKLFNVSEADIWFSIFEILIYIFQTYKSIGKLTQLKSLRLECGCNSYDTGLAEALDGLRQEVLLRVLLFHNYKKHDFQINCHLIKLGAWNSLQSGLNISKCRSFQGLHPLVHYQDWTVLEG